MKILKAILAKCKAEPLAVIALFLSVVLPILQSEWWKNLIAPSVDATAYYVKSNGNRCSLVALSIDNNTSKEVIDIRVNVLTDWIVGKGYESVEVGPRSELLIGSSEETPLPFREELQIEYSYKDDVLKIPSLMPGEYIDLFFMRTFNTKYDKQRSELWKESRFRNTPRIGSASFKNGELNVKNVGQCLKVK